jgi:hypothetical protein
MLKRSCTQNISYAELTAKEMFASWEANVSSVGSIPQILAPEPALAPAPAPAPEPAPSSSSSSVSMFIPHYYVNSLLGLREKFGRTSGEVLIQWKG